MKHHLSLLSYLQCILAIAKNKPVVHETGSVFQGHILRFGDSNSTES